MAKQLKPLDPIYETADSNNALGGYNRTLDGIYAVAKGDGGEKLYEIPQKTNVKPVIPRIAPAAQEADPYADALANLYAKLEGLRAPSYNFSYGDFNSKWEPIRDNLFNAAMNMNYEDWTKGSDYASLANRYKNAGKTAMQDTLGQVAARTGGLASSYAGTAAQQSYNGYMNQLADVARSMYDSDYAKLMNEANTANNYYSQDYNKYAADREYALNAYNKQYASSVDAYNNELNSIYSQLKNVAGGSGSGSGASGESSVSGISSSDIAAMIKSTSGYTDAQLQMYVNSIAGERGLTSQQAQELYSALKQPAAAPAAMTNKEYSDALAALAKLANDKEKNAWIENSGYTDEEKQRLKQGAGLPAKYIGDSGQKPTAQQKKEERIKNTQLSYIDTEASFAADDKELAAIVERYVNDGTITEDDAANIYRRYAKNYR